MLKNKVTSLFSPTTICDEREKDPRIDELTRGAEIVGVMPVGFCKAEHDLYSAVMLSARQLRKPFYRIVFRCDEVCLTFVARPSSITELNKHSVCLRLMPNDN